MKKPELNVSAEIRKILTNNPALSASGVRTIIEKDWNTTLNKNSFSVAFYTSRKALGIKSGSKRSKPIANAAKASPSSMYLQSLVAAADFVRTAGGVDAALDAIKKVQSIQIT